MSEKLEMYVIYRRPSDHPAPYAMRKWHIGDEGATPDDELATGETLDEIRSLIPHNFVRFERNPSDDPVFVESWL